MGVNLTIKSVNKERYQDLELQSAKERLFNFYHPLDNLFNKFQFQHGAHDFSDLTLVDQKNFVVD